MSGDEQPFYDTYWHPVFGVIGFVGAFFTGGLAGGTAFHIVKGLCVSPGGAGARLAGAVHAVRTNAPRVAGIFGGYCAGFSAIESTVSLARGTEDGVSATAAAAATWGLDCLRKGRGAPAALGCALLGATGMWGLVELDRAVIVRVENKRMKKNRAYQQLIDRAGSYRHQPYDMYEDGTSNDCVSTGGWEKSTSTTSEHGALSQP